MSSVTECAQCGMVLLLVLHATGCTSGCTADIKCVDIIVFEFQPELAVSEQLELTVVGDGKTYSGIRTPSSTSGSILFATVADEDAGGILVQSATSMPQWTPSAITYSVVVDGEMAYEGSASPQYQTVTRGNDDCTQTCRVAKIALPPTQGQ